jgi:hypothetical protein
VSFPFDENWAKLAIASSRTRIGKNQMTPGLNGRGIARDVVRASSRTPRRLKAHLDTKVVKPDARS